MSDLSETELKFALTPEAFATLAEDLFGESTSEDLVSVYFDTPDVALQRAAVALRLRRTGDGWVQTLKASGAGAVERFEDERPVATDALEVSHLSEAARSRLPEDGIEGLQRLFETRVTRRIATITQDGASIEAALDEGVIQAGASTEPVRELELELKSGDLAALFAAARAFAALSGVSLSLASKAERGYRLAAGEAGQAVRFQPPRLDFDGPATTAFQALALAALHQVVGNVEVLRERAALEAVHQARVGLRRLRTYVGAFKAWVDDVRLPDVKANLKRLTAVFEDARALDVFELESFAPFARHEAGAAAFGHALLAVREETYLKLQDEVRGRSFARDVFEVAEWVVTGPWVRTLALAPGAGVSLAAAAPRLVARRWRRLLRRGRRLDWAKAPARHKLRIQTKKMRYLTDVLPVRDRRAAKRLQALQAELGELNDIATAHDTARLALAFASPDAALAAGAVVGERRAELPCRIRAARRAFRALARQDRPRLR